MMAMHDLGVRPVETIDGMRLVVFERYETTILAARLWPHFAHLEQVRCRESDEADGLAVQMFDGANWNSCRYVTYALRQPGEQDWQTVERLDLPEEELLP